MKDESGEKIMKEMCALRAKTYSYVSGNNDEDKHKKVSQKIIKFDYYKYCLKATQLENKIDHLQRIKLIQKV